MSTLEISQAPSRGRDDDATRDDDTTCDDDAVKKNDGSATAAPEVEAPSTKSHKRVQFAKELEQGPTPTKDTKKEAKTGINKAYDDEGQIESRREEQSSRTGFLSLPAELRDRIYELIIPLGNLHIDYYDPNGYIIPGRKKGFRHIFCQQEPESDHIAGTTWLEGNDYIQGHQKRHTSTCFNSVGKNGNCSRPRPQYRHPFALLFVCRQTFVDLCARMYKRNAFTFQDLTYLHRFVSQASDAMVRNIQDLRLALRIGDKGIVDSDPVLSIEICSALKGLRRLHISFELCIDGRNAAEDRHASNKMQIAARRHIHLQRILTKKWNSLHWARFGSLQLEDFTIVVDPRPLCIERPGDVHGPGPATGIVNGVIQYQYITKSGFCEEARSWALTVRDEFLKSSEQKSMLEIYLGL